MNFALMVVLKSTIILACAALMSFAWRRGSASTRHAIWALAILSALVLPFVSVLLPRVELPVLPLNYPFLRGGAPERINSSLESEGGVVAHTEAWLVSDHAALRAAPFLEGSRGGELLGLTWLIGLLLVFVRFLLASMAVRRITQHSVDVKDAGWRELSEELRARLSITKPMRLLFHDGSMSPMTWGLCRYVILLPSNAKQWTLARRRLVLTHELAHVKRNDGIMHVAVQLACGVYWFNPMIWYAAHRLCLEREHACDDQVLNHGTNPEDYAEHLIDIARGLCHRSAFTFAAISMAQPSQLETRVRSILDAGMGRRTLSRLATASLLASIAFLTTSIAAIGITSAVPLAPILSAKPVAVPEPVPERPESTTRRKAAPAQRTRIGDAGTVPTAGVTPPQVLSSTQPPYTHEAFAKRIEGTVTIEAAVDTQGNVRVLRTVKGLGYGLDENAARALGQWKFAPALRNGVAVDAITQIDVDFILANDQSMNATLSGTVSSAAIKTPIPGVSVTATDVATGIGTKVMTDETGTYRFASLKPGTYYVTAELPGFKPHSYSTAPISAGQQIRLNFALERRAVVLSMSVDSGTGNAEPSTVGGNVNPSSVVGTRLQIGAAPADGDPETPGPFKIGGDVRPPLVIYRVEPQYSVQARAEHYQGTVVLEAVIQADGSVDVVRIVRSLGFGLDENAVDALKQWKFAPATREGKPVSVSLNIEVNFNLK